MTDLLAAQQTIMIVHTARALVLAPLPHHIDRRTRQDRHTRATGIIMNLTAGGQAIADLRRRLVMMTTLGVTGVIHTALDRLRAISPFASTNLLAFQTSHRITTEEGRSDEADVEEADDVVVNLAGNHLLIRLSALSFQA